MEVKRPLLARKSQGSRCDAMCRMTQVTTDEVDNQTTKRSDILSLFLPENCRLVEDDDLSSDFALAHPIECVVEIAQGQS